MTPHQFVLFLQVLISWCLPVSTLVCGHEKQLLSQSWAEIDPNRTDVSEDGTITGWDELFTRKGYQKEDCTKVLNTVKGDSLNYFEINGCVYRRAKKMTKQGIMAYHGQSKPDETDKSIAIFWYTELQCGFRSNAAFYCTSSGKKMDAQKKTCQPQYAQKKVTLEVHGCSDMKNTDNQFGTLSETRYIMWPAIEISAFTNAAD